MDREEAASAPFDERAAHEDLERLRQEIARSRARRAAIGEEFERFVRSFKTGEAPARRPPPPDAVPAESPPRALETAASASVPNAWRRRPASPTPALVGGALIVLVASGLVVKTIRNRAAESTTPPAANAPEAAAPASEPQPQPQTPSVPAAPVAAPSLESAIITTRRVWMRVTVDGAKVLEREVPAGTRVPLQARETIVIRTGDAGAVRLTLRGQDRGLLGTEGEVVTRSFTVPR